MSAPLASTVAVVAVVAASGYVIGSAPSAVLVARRHGIDPRDRGDRNPGYWNVKELLGRRAALPVLLADAAKGALAAAVALAVTGRHPWGVGYVAVAAAMVGHAWPLFARWRGGRSILTFAGGMCVVSPVAAALAIGACVVVAVTLRSFAHGARVGVFGFPLLQLLVEPATHVAATGALMSFIGLRFAQAAIASGTNR